jgi:rRNA maturation protein Rpf1
LISTSRYASLETRELARALAKERDEPFVSRGKRTMDSLAALARRRGQERILIVEERGQRPSALVTIEVDERGLWRWANERPIADDHEMQARDSAPAGECR